MDYTKTFNELKNIYDPEKESMILPDMKTRMVNVPFRSDFHTDGFLKSGDNLITENTAFTYPVFIPENTVSKKVILLFHGLNERSWLKYLVWGYWLSKNTDSYVVMFPISFHINRSPETWRNPRSMMNLMNERKSSYDSIEKYSFANAALSERLTSEPLRFFNSGYQTVSDIVKLMTSIKDGSHPVIPGESKVDIFAYSIGAFLAEIILLGNPENLFSDSKLFIFCGGSVFSNMQGSSKLIMDSVAFRRVYDYYLYDFEKKIEERNSFSDVLKFSQIGIAFRSMIDHARFRTFRESLFKKLSSQIRTISLQTDIVIPPAGIIKTLEKLKIANSDSVKIWDFPYQCSHENPFPVFDTPVSQLVDDCFKRVFTSAGLFLSGV